MVGDELRFPFAGELREQHDALRTTMRWFQAELDRGEGERLGCARASEFLRVFREQLVEHFRFEELSGFEGGVSSPDSEIQHWTAELMRQHQALEGRLRALLEHLGGVHADEALPAPLLAELRAFFSSLRRHDAEENALILWISQGPTDFVRQPEAS
jgi:hypothetical protein